ncbi:hypothetical protein [Coleofasciculus sp. H7-2]|uniref:hypothetical protein n=1 Tax=Coleofasciculus sp. H7-2 TaxID=3351545 RepID=UPI00366F311F
MTSPTPKLRSWRQFERSPIDKARARRELIDRSLERGYRPGIVLIDAGYGNNIKFLLELEKRKLRYLGD